MKKILNAFIISLVCLACSSTNSKTTLPIANEKTTTYWNNGKAEITSFALEQARYGEIHKGTSVMIFVTEPFSPTDFVKADQASSASENVLKLNFTKKFNTGIYPYSMMTSTFFPLNSAEHSLKVSSSSQEWCGHTYMELLNKAKYDITINSYFEGESKHISLPKSMLEDDIWSMIRLSPDLLPTGNLEMIPSFFYLRLRHQETKPYKCSATVAKEGANKIYSITYPELSRTLKITYENVFPFQIVAWEETYSSGWGNNAAMLTTSAKKLATIRSDYWNHNSVADSTFRKKLQLD